MTNGEKILAAIEQAQDEQVRRFRAGDENAARELGQRIADLWVAFDALAELDALDETDEPPTPGAVLRELV